MIALDELCPPGATRSLQAMMLRWEQQQPVNAVHVAWLQKSFRPLDIKSATTKAVRRLLSSNPARLSDQQSGIAELFEFRQAEIAGDWRINLQSAVTNELNTPFPPGSPPLRISVFDDRRLGQFLMLGYRHVIADARSITLLLHEIIHYLSSPVVESPCYAATCSGESLDRLFPSEYRARRIPVVAWNLVTEFWKSLRCTRLPAHDRADLRMECRLHQSSLPLAALKDLGSQLGATFNDLILAALLEWFAREYPFQKSRGRELAIATLVDLYGRAAILRPHAFGQFLTSFAVRVPATAQMPFEEIVRLVARETQSCKQVAPLLINARSFEFLAREWDLIPFTRRPEYLPAVLPLLAGISNVNLPGIIGQPEQSLGVRNYFRGTCVTNLLPMMLSITTVGDTCSLSTTHRSAVFTAAQMDDLAAHVGRRLFGEQIAQRRAAA